MCTYVISCDLAKENIELLPENPRTEWGPGEDLIQAGLEPLTHKDGIIEADDEPVEVWVNN